MSAQEVLSQSLTLSQWITVTYSQNGVTRRSADPQRIAATCLTFVR